MKVISLNSCETFIAGDKSILKEILNPIKEELSLNYSLAYAVVKPNKKTSKHKLKSSEVYYIISGKGIMHIDDQSKNIEANDTIYIPPNSIQWVENILNDELVFLCIVEPAWMPSMEEILN